MLSYGFGFALGLARRRGGGGGGPAPLTNPLLAGLGGSRVRQAGLGATNVATELTGGALSWMKALDPRQRFTAWFDATAEQNSNNLNGMLFANDGNGFPAMRARLPKLISSDANIILMDLSSNSIQFDNPDGTTFTAAAYCAEAQAIASTLKANGKRVCIMSVVERPTSAGGPWAAGQAPRLLIPAINSQMQAWAASEGMAYADIRSVLIDFNDPDRNPLPFGVRDGTHWSTQGGYAIAKVINTAIAPFIAASPAATLMTGPNLLTNPAFTGTGGTVTGAGLSGSVPDNWTLSRETSASSLATVVASVIDITGTRWLRLLVSSSGMASDRCEGVRVTGTVGTVASGVWHAGSVEADVKAWGGWRTTGRVSIASGSNTGVGLSGINPSGTPMPSPEFSLLPMAFPTEDYRVRIETFPISAGATSATFMVQVFFGQATGLGEILIALPRFSSVADPNLLMRNEADTTPISITSPAAMTEPEGNGAFVRQLAANKPFARWSLAGADAALFAVDPFGRLTGPEFDFETPADAGANNVYDLTITATDFNPANGSANRSATITVTDVNDGFFDNFNRANELLDASANWTRQGAGTGTISIVSNQPSVTGGTGGRVVYLAPQQGDTIEQQIAVSMRTSASSAASMVIAGLDATNWLGIQANASGNMRIIRMDANVQSTVGDCPFYTPYVSGVRITAQLRAGMVRVFQSGVLIGEFSITVPATWKRSGLAINTSNASPWIDDWNNRLAAPITPLVGLRALTVTPTTHVGSSGDYEGAIAGRTSGSNIVVSAVTGPGGTWLADGNTLRGVSLAVGSHQVTLTETFSGAINNGRASVVTVTVT